MKRSPNTSFKCLFLLCLLLGIAPFSYAQYDYGKTPFYTQAAVHVGRVIPNGNMYDYLWDVRMYGFEIGFGKQTYGKKDWEKWANYPSYGFTFRYLNFDYDCFGGSLALFGFFDGTILRHQFFTLKYGVGAGIVFFPNHYDVVENWENIFIGSTLNAHIDLNLSAEFSLSQSTDLFVRANFSHSSNGTTTLPNKGLNALSAGVGLRYHFFKKPPFLSAQDSVVHFRQKNRFHVAVMPGFKQSTTDFNYYYKQSIQVGYTRQFHPLFRYGGGIDFNYSADLMPLLPHAQKDVFHCMNVAAYTSFDFLFGRMNFHAALGCYLYRGFDYYSLIYERVGVRFFVDKQFDHFIGVAVKAHGGKADYIEWTYGYSFVNWNDKAGKVIKRKR